MGTVVKDKWQQVRQFMARYLSKRELDPKGFTILELLVVTMIIGTLSSMVAPPLQRARERAFVAVAMAEIRIISSELAIYIEINYEPPVSLAAIDRATLLDPWGNPYMYVKLQGTNGNGSARKNKFQVPLNDDYDLGSAGPDGLSKGALTAKDSKDDILRAWNGAFIGLATDL
jgi:general secretion pathway protein G